jgi:hypothetical protein
VQTNRWTAEGVALPSDYSLLWFEKHRTDSGDPNATATYLDSVQNRLLTTLRWLHLNFPRQGWNAYYYVTCGMLCITKIRWDLITLAGHSHGSRETTHLAKTYSLDRVLLFAGPGNDLSSATDDASAVPTYIDAPSATASTRWYAFVSYFDPDIWDIYTNLKYGIHRGATLSYFYPDYGQDPGSAERLAVGTADPVPQGCVDGHNWIIKPCGDSLERYQPVWDWMLRD